MRIPRVPLAGATARPRAVRAAGGGGEPIDLVELLERGGVLAVPTESSYGLAADPRNAEGVAAIYRVKVREKGKPLPVVAADRSQVVALGVDPGRPELALAERLWPGPVTVVLPIDRPLPAAAGEPTIAVRVPAHDGLRRLLERLGRPLTATSANRSGMPAVLDPEGAAGVLAPLAGAGREAPLAAVVDGGVLPGGPPSTIVRFAPGSGVASSPGAPEILREGAVPAAEIARRSKV